MNICLVLLLAAATSAAPRADKDVFAFEKKAYIASYTPGEGQLDLAIKVKYSNVTGTTFEFDKEYEKNFKVDFDDKTGNVTLSLTDTKLAEDVAVHIVKITAKRDKKTAVTDVFVKLPSTEPLCGFQFSNNVYDVEYKDGKLTSESEITISGDTNGVDVVVNNDNFNATLDGGKVTLLLNDGKTPGDVTTINEVIVTLNATKGDQTETADVVVKIPRDPNPNPLHFSDNVYFLEYTESANKGQLKPTSDDNEITIAADDLWKVTLKLSEEDKNFQIDSKPDPNTGVVKFTLKSDGLQDEADANELVVTIIATVDDQSVTSDVVVLIPKAIEPPSTPIQFSSNIEVAALTEENDSIELDLTLDGDDIRGIILSLDPDDYFTANLDVTNGKVSLTVISKAKSLRETKNEQLVTITAKKGDDVVDSADVVVTLPKPQPPTPLHFSSNVYTTTYQSLDDVDISYKAENLEDVMFKQDLDSQEYVTATPDKKTGKVTLSLASETPPDDLNELIVALTIDTGSDSVRSDVIVQLISEKDPDTDVHFEKNIYLGNYADGTIRLDDEIIVGGGSAVTPQSAQVVGDYEDNFSFTIDKTGKSGSLKVTNNLASEILKKYNEIILTLEATVEENNNPVTINTEVVLRLPNTQTPTPLHFKSNVYRGIYKKEDSTVTLDSDIVFVAEDFGKVSLSSQDNASKKYVKASIDDEVQGRIKLEYASASPSDQNEIIVTITIKADASNTATADIVLAIPRSPAIEEYYSFDRNVYQATYSEADNKGSIASDPIQINKFPTDADDLTTLKIVVDNSYFEGDVTEKGVVTLSPKSTKLPAVVLKKNDVILHVSAKDSADTEVASTDVIVKLPSTQPTTPLQFLSNIYIATYKGNGTITTESDITIEGEDLTDLDLKVDKGNSKIFTAQYDNGKVTLSATPADVPTDKKEIVVTITANDVASTDVVVELPRVEEANCFHFLSSVYVAEYTEENGKGSIQMDDGDITLTGEANPKNVTFTFDGHDKVFTPTVDADGKVTLGWKGSRSDLKDSKDYLEIKITAKDSDQTSNATLYLIKPDASGAGHVVAGVTLVVSILAVLLI